MAYRELELTLLSAQELKSVNLITRMDVYAVVSISNDPLTRQCTETDTYGGRNPCWNATFRFAVPPTAAAAAGGSLHVLLRAERFLGDRDVGEVVVPLAEIYAGATGAGPQPPRVASYQVRKLHRREHRGVLNVSYRLGPVVAPVLQRAPTEKVVYAPVAVPPPPPQPPHQQPSAAVAYYQQYQQAPPAPAPGRPAVRGAVAEHNEAAQNKSPARHEEPPPPRPAPVHTPRHEEPRRAPTPPAPAPTPTPPPAPAPAPPATNGGSNGLSQAGATHFNWALLTQGTYAAAAESMSVSVLSPRSRQEDRWRPSVFSKPQHDTQQQQKAASSPVAAAAPSPHRLAASPFSSRSSSFSSPLSPYSSAHPSPSPSPAHSYTRSPYSAYSAHPPTATSPHQPPSPSPSSAHSSTRSPYSTHSAHPSAATSPHRPPLRLPVVSDGAEVTHQTNSTFRSTSSRASSPSPSSSPMVPNHSRGAAASSPLPSSSPMVPKHSSVVPSF